MYDWWTGQNSSVDADFFEPLLADLAANRKASIGLDDPFPFEESRSTLTEPAWPLRGVRRFARDRREMAAPEQGDPLAWSASQIDLKI